MPKIEYEIDRKDFETFLSENPARVFEQNLPWNCAITRYLESVGMEDVRCYHEFAFYGIENRQRIDIPAWLKAISAMHHGIPESGLEPEPFTGKEILDFLATLPEEKQ